MAYVIEIGILDDLGNEVPDYSAKDIYNEFDQARKAYDDFTNCHVHTFLEKDLGFEETDLGYYKKMTQFGMPVITQRWWFENE